MAFFSRFPDYFSKVRWTRLVLLCIFWFSILHALIFTWQGDRWQRVVDGDGIGYYSYMPATFIYQDYTFHFIDSVSAQYPHLQIARGCGFCNRFDDQLIDKYFVGPAVLATPFFLVGHLLSWFGDTPQDGYSFFYVFMVTLGAIGYLLLGLWCISRLLKRFGVRDGHIALILVCIFAGSNLYFYSEYNHVMSHIYSFSMIACFALVLHKQLETFSAWRLVLLGMLLGLIVIIRPVNVMVVLSLPFLAGNWETLKRFFRETFSHYFVLLVAIVAFLLVLFIQLGYYHSQCGKWIVYAYSKEGFDFLHPHFFQCLFSYSNGFYVYAPILFVATLGIFTQFRKEKFRFFAFLFFFTVFTWVISSWWAWTYGGAFGMRPFVEYIPFFAICFGFLLKALPEKRFLLPALSFFIFLPLVFLIQFQTWQFMHGIIGWDKMTKEKYWHVFLENRQQFMGINIDFWQDNRIPKEAKLVYSMKCDYEKTDTLMDQRSIISEKAFSGKRCLELRTGNNYAPRWKGSFSKMISDSVLVHKNIWLEMDSKWMLEDNGSEARVFVEVYRRGYLYYIASQYVIHEISEENKWCDYKWILQLPPLQPGDELVVYPRRDIWYPVYVDDFSVRVFAQ